MTGTKVSLFSRIKIYAARRFESRYLPVWIGAVAIFLTISSLAGGLIMDDYHHCLVMKDPDNPNQFLNSKLDLFRFMYSTEGNNYLIDRGFMAWAFDQLFRRPENSFALGDKVELTGLTIEITELMPDGRPAQARFTSPVALEDDCLRWLEWKNWRLEPFTPPDVGQTVILENFD